VRAQERDSKEQFGDAPAWVTLGRPSAGTIVGRPGRARHPSAPPVARRSRVASERAIRSEGAPPVAATEEAWHVAAETRLN
jgi:hypothetical protein